MHMDNNQQMQTILTTMEQHNRKQLLWTKLLCLLCALLVICSLVVMVTIASTAAQLTELAAPIQTLTTSIQDLIVPIQDLATQAQAVLTDLGTAANALTLVDFSAMASQVETLAADSQAAVTEAMIKLDAIDIDTLNKAIKDLAAIVDPLAKVGKLFG